MKKLFSIFLAMVLLLTANICVFASDSQSGKTARMSSFEISAKRVVGKIMKKSTKDVVKDILIDAGISNFIDANNLSNEKIEQIYNCKSISYNEAYGKFDENGNEQVITKEQYFTSPNSEIRAFSLTSENPVVTSDECFEKEIAVFETGRGHGFVVLSFGWLNSPVWRGTDIIGVSSEHLIFRPSTAQLLYTYNLYYPNIKTEEKVFEYNYSEMQLPNNTDPSPYFFTVMQNLTNDYGYGASAVHVDNMAFMLMIDFDIDQPMQINNFNVYGSYYHQKLGVGSFGVSVSGGGFGFSVSPAYRYTNGYDIVAEMHYEP